MRRQRNTLAANAPVRVRAIAPFKYARGVDKTSMSKSAFDRRR